LRALLSQESIAKGVVGRSRGADPVPLTPVDRQFMAGAGSSLFRYTLAPIRKPQPALGAGGTLAAAHRLSQLDGGKHVSNPVCYPIRFDVGQR
jgi:hypothetical protein